MKPKSDKRGTKECASGPPARRLALFNATGILVALSTPLLIERHLQTFTLPKQANWPWTGPWFQSFALALACAAFDAGLTFWTLDRKTVGGRNVWVAPLCVGAAIVLLASRFPWGSWPHMGMCLWAVAFAALSHAFVVCSKAREKPPAPNIETLKATISTWQLIVVYSFTAYLAFAISSLYIMWLVTEVLTAKEERLLLFSSVACQIAVFSALIFMGPLREAWQMTFESVGKLKNFSKSCDAS